MTRATIGAWGVVMAALVGRPAYAGDAPTPPTEVARAVEPAGDVPYDSTGRRDPFRPPRAGSVHTGEPQTPLQRYEIGQLRLVAVIYATADPRAVVEDDQGLGYIVHVGTPIGLNGGQVRAIERGRVLITETAVDYYGEQRLNEVTMELRTATAQRGKQ